MIYNTKALSSEESGNDYTKEEAVMLMYLVNTGYFNPFISEDDQGVLLDNAEEYLASAGYTAEDFAKYLILKGKSADPDDLIDDDYRDKLAMINDAIASGSAIRYNYEFNGKIKKRLIRPKTLQFSTIDGRFRLIGHSDKGRLIRAYIRHMTDIEIVEDMGVFDESSSDGSISNYNGYMVAFKTIDPMAFDALMTKLRDCRIETYEDNGGDAPLHGARIFYNDVDEKEVISRLEAYIHKITLDDSQSSSDQGCVTRTAEVKKYLRQNIESALRRLA